MEIVKVPTQILLNFDSEKWFWDSKKKFEVSRKVENHKEVTSGDDLSCLAFGIDLLPIHHQYFQYGSNQQFSNDIGISDW